LEIYHNFFTAGLLDSNPRFMNPIGAPDQSVEVEKDKSRKEYFGSFSWWLLHFMKLDQSWTMFSPHPPHER
jgi:hypothetical protein